MGGLRAGVGEIARRAVRTQAAEMLVDALEMGATRTDRRAPATLSILTYHRVNSLIATPELAPTMVTADVPIFRSHMDAICDVSTPVSLHDVLRSLDGDTPLPPRAVLVTFDDGYRDFVDHAWPILVERSIPAVMFVPTAFPGDPSRAFWWDVLWSAVARGAVPDSVGLRTEGRSPLDQFRDLRDRVLCAPLDQAEALVAEIAGAPGAPMPSASVLDWQTLRDLSSAGLAVAAHTHTHAPLHKLSSADAQAEIERSIHELRTRGFGDTADVLAYPGGGQNEHVRSAAAAAGVRLAMTTERGVNRLDLMERLRLRRINVGRATSPAVLRAQLVPSLARIPRWGSPSP